MRVSAAQTPKYTKKQMKREIMMLKGMECCGFKASSPAGRVEILSGKHAGMKAQNQISS